MHEGYLISKFTNKVIRTIDTIQEEERYFAKKLSSISDLIDLKVQENIPVLMKIVAAMKYYYGMN